MAERHVSRWRRPSERAGAAPSAPVAEASASGVSLRYLDEFVRKLQCAPRLLEHQLFPDAKEITESMGLFNAVRRYVVTGESGSGDEPSGDALADGIVVVGDGNTPRSAAMFAYRLKQWKCYSIDPAMELPATAERAQRWETIENLVVIRNKIENVRIRLRRAVVVLVHAHVTLPQALSAVECEDLVGVVTMPCCNWYGKQEELFGKPPDLVYDDFSILSDHRELRVWVDPRGTSSSFSSQATVLALDQSTTMMKGCVQKEFIADYGVAKTSRANGGSLAQPEGDAAIMKRETKNATATPTALFHELLLSEARADDTTSRTAVATPAQLKNAAVHAEATLDKRTARVLVLAAGECDVTSTLLRHGFANVFNLRLPTGDSMGKTTEDSLTTDVVRMGLGGDDCLTESTTASLRVQTTESTSEAYEMLAGGLSFQSFDCVVDCAFLHRCLRNQPKKACGAVFEHLVKLTLSLTAAAAAAPRTTRWITISPRKDWRKTDFLANPRLSLDFSSSQIAPDGPGSSTLYVYSCRTSSADAGGHIEPDFAIDSQAEKKLLALELKEALDRDFKTVSIGDAVAVTLAEAKLLASTDQTCSGRSPVVVRGIVHHLRRFTTGPSFFSVAPATSASSASASFRDHLQVSLEPSRLRRWGEADARSVTLDAVFRLLHKGDSVECVGEMALNAQQQPMLRLDALRFLQSEFQAYQ